MEGADFVVVGGGIAGASAAYELAAHGRVMLVEQEPVCGYHTTGRSAALFTEAYETGVMRALARASRPFLEDPPPGFAPLPILRPLPMLTIARPDQLPALEALARDAGPLVRTLDEDGVYQLCPLVRPGYAVAGVVEPGSCAIDVAALHQGYLSGIRRRGGEIRLRARVTGLDPGARGWIVRSGAMAITTPVVVDAAGAWADRVAGLAGLPPIGLTPLRRTAFTFDPPGSGTAGLPFVADVDEGFYFKPEGGSLMGCLADETPMHPHDVRPDEADVALAIERIEAATTLAIRHVRSAWAGLRTFARDRVPVIGPEPTRPGFFWLAGQGGYGILTAPAAARALASLVVGGTWPVGPAARPATVSPARIRR